MRASHGNGTKVEVWETLTAFHTRHATNDRDKVYGIFCSSCSPSLNGHLGRGQAMIWQPEALLYPCHYLQRLNHTVFTERFPHCLVL
ncbi:hypothetical protein V8C37DRAFT_371073 [Trichoderma ceciliae]